MPQCALLRSRHQADSNLKELAPMKMLLTVIGLVLLAVAAMYFLMPADSLPSFFPGYEAGLARIRVKHGVVAAIAGVVALAAGWFAGRR
jgi:hypothetical protein